MGIKRALLGWKHLGVSSVLFNTPGCKTPPFPRAGGPPWATLGGSSQEKGLQVHREGSTWKQMRMW